MKNNRVSKLAVLAAACIMTLSTVADAGGRGGDRGDNHDRNGHRNSIEFWKKHGSDHENGCAIGNDPPPGANCTDRYDQQ